MKKIGIILLMLIALLFTGCRGMYDRYDETGFLSGEGEISELVKNIEIFWHTGDILIEYGETETIKIEEKSDYVINSSEEVRYKYENQNLTIRYCQSNLLLPAANFEKNLKIIVPNDYVFDTLSVINITGDLFLKVNCESTNVEVVTGDVISNNNYKEASYDIDVVTGNIKVNSFQTNKFTSHLVTGDINLNTQKVTGGVFVEAVTGNVLMELGYWIGGGNIDLVTGDIEIYTDKLNNVQINYDIVTGDIDFSLNASQLSNDTIKIGDCTYTLNIDVTTGDLKIIDRARVE